MMYLKLLLLLLLSPIWVPLVIWDLFWDWKGKT